MSATERELLDSIQRNIEEIRERKRTNSSNTSFAQERSIDYGSESDSSQQLILPSDPQYYDETKAEFTARQYQDKGLNVTPDFIKTAAGENFINAYREGKLVTNALKNIENQLWPIPQIVMAAPKKIKETIERVRNLEYEDVNFSMSDPTLATLERSSIKQKVQQFPIVAGPFSFFEWLASPVLYPLPAAVTAPFAKKDYVYSMFENPVKYTAEVWTASGEGFFNEIFPKYGEIRNYGYQVMDAQFPGASEDFKVNAGNFIDVFGDPTIWTTLGARSLFKAGTQLTKAQIKAGIKPRANPLRKGIEAYLGIEQLDPDIAKELQRELTLAEAGSMEAASRVKELLQDKKVEEWVKTTNAKWYRGFKENLKEVYDKPRADMERELFPQVVGDFKREAVRAKTQEKLDKLKELYSPESKEYKKRRVHAYKTSEQEMKSYDLTKQDLLDIDAEVKYRADHMEALKINEWITRAFDFRTEAGKKKLQRMLGTKEGHKALKINLNKLDPEEYEGALGALYEEFKNIYRQHGGGKTTMKEVYEKSLQIELGYITGETMPINQLPEVTWAASNMFKVVYDEVLRLSDLMIKNPDVFTANAYKTAFRLAGQLPGLIERIAESSGQTLRTFREIKRLKGAEKSFDDMISIVSKMEAINENTDLQLHAAIFRQADAQGLGVPFTRKMVRVGRIIEDSLFEIYTNALVSAMRTLKLNVTSTGTHIAIQPLNKLGTGFVGNPTAIGESIQMSMALSESVKESLMMYANEIVKKKYFGRIEFTKAKQAMNVRMMNLADKYPEHYLAPLEYTQTGKGTYTTEIEKINARKSISSINWGIIPRGPLSRIAATGIDASGAFIRAPGTTMKMQDLGFKYLAYNMAARAAAYRQISNETKGLINPFTVNKRIKEITDNPTDAMRKEAIRFADYNTFQLELDKFSKAIQQPMKSRVGRWFFPFTVTPINIAKVSLEYNLPGYGKALYKALKEGDTVEAQMATARATMGTLTFMALVGASLDGDNVGGFDVSSDYGRKMISLEAIPYSFNKFNKYWGYGDIPFMRGTLGLAADYTRIMAQLNFENPEDFSKAEKLTAAVLMPFAKLAFDQRWTMELGRMLYFIEAMGETHESLAETASRKAGRMVSNLIPYSSLMREFNSIVIDEELKIARGFVDEIKKTIPGESKELAGYKNIAGDPMLASENFGPDMHHKLLTYIMPVQYKNAKELSVYDELKKLPLNLRPIVFKHKGVQLTPKQISDVQLYSGKGTGDMPTFIEAIGNEMTKSSYINSTIPNKARIVEYIHNQYVTNAINKVVEDSQYEYSEDGSLFEKIQRREMWEMNQYLQPGEQIQTPF